MQNDDRTIYERHTKETRNEDRKKEREKRASHSATCFYTGWESGVADTGAVLQMPHSSLWWTAYPGPSSLAVEMHECPKGNCGLVSCSAP